MPQENRIDKKRARRLLDKAWDASNQGDNQLAFKTIDEAICWFPTHWYLWASKATFLLELDRLSESEAAARRSLSLDKEQALVWGILGRIHLREQAFEEAAECLGKSNRLKEDFGTLTMLAAAEIHVNVKRALKYAERALVLNPDWDEARSIKTRAVRLIAEGKERA